MDILESLAKKDRHWRSVAYKMTGSKLKADNIVQNMYMKIHKANPDKWNYTYVYITMRNLFKDLMKPEKYNTEIIDNTTEDVTIAKESSYSSRELKVLDSLDSLTDEEKELLLLNYDLSVGKIALRNNDCRVATYRRLIKIRKKILGEDLEGYNNKRLKHRRQWKR
jgi:DNA-directed RNA polymerase specialized sigma24 family protein